MAKIACFKLVSDAVLNIKTANIFRRINLYQF